MKTKPRWQTLTGDTQIERDYRALGNHIAAVLALERGELLTVSNDAPPLADGEPLGLAGQELHLRACLRLVRDALAHSLKAVVNCRPQIGDRVILVQVECISGLDTDERTGYHALN